MQQITGTGLAVAVLLAFNHHSGEHLLNYAGQPGAIVDYAKVGGHITYVNLRENKVLTKRDIYLVFLLSDGGVSHSNIVHQGRHPAAVPPPLPRQTEISAGHRHRAGHSNDVGTCLFFHMLVSCFPSVGPLGLRQHDCRPVRPL